jgi:hypothetical protein
MTKDTATLTSLARFARETAAFGQRLEALAERIEDTIDGLAGEAGVTVDEIYWPLWQD